MSSKKMFKEVSFKNICFLKKRSYWNWTRWYLRVDYEQIRFYFSHLAMLVHVVVRQLHFLERNNLFSQLLAGEGWIGMDVKSRGRRRIGFAGFQPTATMIGVSIPLVVDRHNIHQYCVTTFGLESGEGYSARRKHPSVKECTYRNI